MLHGIKLLTLLPWAAIILFPLAALYLWPARTPAIAPAAMGMDFLSLTLHSLGIAAVVAAIGTVLGYIPGRLLGTSRRHQGLLLTILLANLVLPQYVLYFAWSVLLSPTTIIGQYTTQDIGLARLAGTITSGLVVCLWCWPLAALLIAQGFRSLDADVWQTARLDAAAPSRFLHVTLPLLAKPLALAFGVCLTFTLGEFAAFSLAGIKTVGTELAVLFDRTQSPETVARAAWPLTVIALVVALPLWRKTQDWSLQPAAGIESEGSSKSNRWRWLVVAMLVCVSLIAPVGLLVLALRDLSPFANFWSLQRDGLLFGQTTSPPWFDLTCPGSMPISAVAALLAMAVCLPTFLLRQRWLVAVLYVTIFAAALLPGSVIAAAVFKACGVLGLAEFRKSSWLIVSVGLAARFAGVLLIVLHLTRSREDRHLAELAAVDGASAYQAWRWVHLPRHWTLALGGLVLVWMLGLTEVAATIPLLPPGVPNFAQRLLDQMHFARQQQAVASCLIVVGIYVALAVLAAAMLRVLRSPGSRRTKAGGAP
jgi:ABC-type Fe3+ transport system permease subunit